MTCRMCGMWRSRCETCDPTSVDAALRVAAEAAAMGEPVPTAAANVLLEQLDELHERRPSVLVRLMLRGPDEHGPAHRPLKAP